MSWIGSNHHPRVHLYPSGRVDCRAELDLPMSPAAAWGQLRDFRRSASQDFFHSDIQIEGGIPRAGAQLVLEHRFGLRRVRRVGRILRWREWGSETRLAGYSFSDLSRHGPRKAFPHVLGYYLNAAPAGSCRLLIVVRGRWTANLVPRWAARLWLAWVFHHMVISVRNELLAAAVEASVRKQNPTAARLT